MNMVRPEKNIAAIGSEPCDELIVRLKFIFIITLFIFFFFCR